MSLLLSCAWRSLGKMHADLFEINLWLQECLSKLTL